MTQSHLKLGPHQHTTKYMIGGDKETLSASKIGKRLLRKIQVVYSILSIYFLGPSTWFGLKKYFSRMAG